VLSPAIAIIEDIVANNETTPAAITFATTAILPVRGQHLTAEKFCMFVIVPFVAPCHGQRLLSNCSPVVTARTS